MALDDRSGMPILGSDWDLERWSTGETDEKGNLIWNHYFPDNEDWANIRKVTLNLEPTGHEPMFRNYDIEPKRPLDIPNTFQSGMRFYFDIYDVALAALSSYFGAYGGEE